MRVAPSFGEIFICLNAEKWENLSLPPNSDRTQIKREVQNAIWWFRCGKEVGPDYDLASLQRKVRATRELLKDRELLERLILGNSEELVRQLHDIELKLNASIWAIKQGPRAVERARREPDALLLEQLLFRLVVLWKRAGGSVGGGAPRGRPGGPLIRFLRFAADHVGVDLTPDAARGWIRRFKNEDWNDLTREGWQS
jgi:hypothetical protein